MRRHLGLAECRCKGLQGDGEGLRQSRNAISELTKDNEALRSFKKSINVLLAIQNGTKLPEDEQASEAEADEEDGKESEWAESSTDWADFATRSFDPRMVELPQAVRRRSSRGELPLGVKDFDRFS